MKIWRRAADGRTPTPLIVASDETRLGFLLAWMAERSFELSIKADVSESEEGGWFSSPEDGDGTGRDVGNRAGLVFGLRDVCRLPGALILAALDTSRLRSGLVCSSPLEGEPMLSDIVGATGEPPLCDCLVFDKNPAWNLLGFECRLVTSGTSSDGLDSSSKSFSFTGDKILGI